MALGLELEKAIDAAKRYVSSALQAAERIGHGAIPLNHLVKAELSGQRETA
jgi:hydroxymethylpyrimidine/phosphomethylpyrimidine kinase